MELNCKGNERHNGHLKSPPMIFRISKAQADFRTTKSMCATMRNVISLIL